MGYAVLAHRDFNFHTGVVNFAQYFFNPAYRLTKKRGRLGQLHHHHLADFGGASGALWNQHILAVTLVLRSDQPDTAFL